MTTKSNKKFMWVRKTWAMIATETFCNIQLQKV